MSLFEKSLRKEPEIIDLEGQEEISLKQVRAEMEAHGRIASLIREEIQREKKGGLLRGVKKLFGEMSKRLKPWKKSNELSTKQEKEFEQEKIQIMGHAAQTVGDLVSEAKSLRDFADEQLAVEQDENIRIFADAILRKAEQEVQKAEMAKSDLPHPENLVGSFPLPDIEGLRHPENMEGEIDPVDLAKEIPLPEGDKSFQETQEIQVPTEKMQVTPTQETGQDFTPAGQGDSFPPTEYVDVTAPPPPKTAIETAPDLFSDAQKTELSEGVSDFEGIGNDEYYDADANYIEPEEYILPEVFERETGMQFPETIERNKAEIFEKARDQRRKFQKTLLAHSTWTEHPNTKGIDLQFSSYIQSEFLVNTKMIQTAFEGVSPEVLDRIFLSEDPRLQRDIFALKKQIEEKHGSVNGVELDVLLMAENPLELDDKLDAELVEKVKELQDQLHNQSPITLFQKYLEENELSKTNSVPEGFYERIENEIKDFKNEGKKKGFISDFAVLYREFRRIELDARSDRKSHDSLLLKTNFGTDIKNRHDFVNFVLENSTEQVEEKASIIRAMVGDAGQWTESLRTVNMEMATNHLEVWEDKLEKANVKLDYETFVTLSKYLIGRSNRIRLAEKVRGPRRLTTEEVTNIEGDIVKYESLGKDLLEYEREYLSTKANEAEIVYKEDAVSKPTSKELKEILLQTLSEGFLQEMEDDFTLAPESLHSAMLDQMQERVPVSFDSSQALEGIELLKVLTLGVDKKQIDQHVDYVAQIYQFDTAQKESLRFLAKQGLLESASVITKDNKLVITTTEALKEGVEKISSDEQLQEFLGKYESLGKYEEYEKQAIIGVQLDVYSELLKRRNGISEQVSELFLEIKTENDLQVEFDRFLSDISGSLKEQLGFELSSDVYEKITEGKDRLAMIIHNQLSDKQIESATRKFKKLLNKELNKALDHHLHILFLQLYDESTASIFHMRLVDKKPTDINDVEGQAEDLRLALEGGYSEKEVEGYLEKPIEYTQRLLKTFGIEVDVNFEIHSRIQDMIKSRIEQNEVSEDWQYIETEYAEAQTFLKKEDIEFALTMVNVRLETYESEQSRMKVLKEKVRLEQVSTFAEILREANAQEADYDTVRRYIHQKPQWSIYESMWIQMEGESIDINELEQYVSLTSKLIVAVEADKELIEQTISSLVARSSFLARLVDFVEQDWNEKKNARMRLQNEAEARQETRKEYREQQVDQLGIQIVLDFEEEENEEFTEYVDNVKKYAVKQGYILTSMQEGIPSKQIKDFMRAEIGTVDFPQAKRKRNFELFDKVFSLGYESGDAVMQTSKMLREGKPSTKSAFLLKEVIERRLEKENVEDGDVSSWVELEMEIGYLMDRIPESEVSQDMKESFLGYLLGESSDQLQIRLIMLERYIKQKEFPGRTQTAAA